MRNIKKPIFIVGVARSGTTVFYNMLATYPGVTWFSNYSNALRAVPQAALLHRLLDVPGIGERIRQNIVYRKGFKLTPRPNEGEEIYQDQCKFPFNTGMAEKDQYPEQAEKLRKVIASHLKYSGKQIFISKQTANNRRIRLLNSIFPDARFIHIIRDGRAVARSVIHEDWWKDIDFWWLNKNAGEFKNDPLLMFLEYWKRVHDDISLDADFLGDRYMEFRYEDFVIDVKGTMRCILDFLELEQDKQFIARLPEILPNMNYKWQTEFTTEQKQQAVEIIGPKLLQYNYQLE
jgi:hypothetical protein